MLCVRRLLFLPPIVSWGSGMRFSREVALVQHSPALLDYDYSRETVPIVLFVSER
jgi:hypothetical protein